MTRAERKTPNDFPLAAARVFAAAGRLGSFREAARALEVTPSAVSHQVKALERFVGAPLFERGARHVRLTLAGEELSAALNAAFADIELALTQARAATAPKELKIAALPLFVEVWLAPRLKRFEAAHPNLSLALDTDARVFDLMKGEADVAIRNVPAPTPGLFVRKLIDLRATPLCAPELTAELKTPADLAHASLIALNVGRGWREWLAAVGAEEVKPKRTLTFDALPAAIAAAAEGRGVILGLMPFVFSAPGAERLVAPFSTPPQDAGAYFVACRKEDRATGVVSAFIDWIFEEMRADRRRLAAIERRRLKAAG